MDNGTKQAEYMTIEATHDDISGKSRQKELTIARKKNAGNKITYIIVQTIAIRVYFFCICAPCKIQFPFFMN